MLIIRLQRVGRTNDPSFRVVVTDSKNSAKSGKFLAVVGSYDARQGKPQLDSEKIKEYIKNGAQVSDTVHNLLVKYKVIEGQSKNLIPAKKVTENPTPAEAKAPEAPVEAPKEEAAPVEKPAEEAVESASAEPEATV